MFELYSDNLKATSVALDERVTQKLELYDVTGRILTNININSLSPKIQLFKLMQLLVLAGHILLIAPATTC